MSATTNTLPCADRKCLDTLAAGPALAGITPHHTEGDAKIELTLQATHDNHKHLSDLKAELALRGHALQVHSHMVQTHYVVSRRGRCRACGTGRDLNGFLALIGVQEKGPR